MASKERFEGQVAIVTGGTRGIGRAVVANLLAGGARVVATGRSKAAGDTMLAEFGHVEELRYFQQDVAIEADWHRLLAYTAEQFGQLDILVNNAGMTDTQTIAQSSVAEFRAVIETNLISVFMGMKFGAALMLRDGRGGVIVNLSSVSAGKADSVLPAYSASKAALERLTRCAVREYGEAGQPIRVNAIRPGYIDTDFGVPSFIKMMGSREAGVAFMKSLHPIGRVGQPADIAAMVAFLCSAEAGFITGSVIDVDGGFLT
jgi:NAD(P)-dependent dehydrogenase (short-subunit alcohol dehydrogenase family)